MRTIVQSSRFKKDLKRATKRGCEINRLKETVTALVNGEKLPARMVPHTLTGEYRGVTECHLAPDWLLLYEVTADSLYLYRTGTHTDLFE